MPNKRTIDLLTESYKDQMTARRKYEFKNSKGEKVVDLYFKPLTRYDRQLAQGVAGTDEALTVSTQLLCQMAELEDGTKAFALADAPNLQRELPENILNEIELFLFDIKLDVDTAKKGLRRDSWLNFEFFLAIELGKTINELRTSISEEELIYWAAYYENKYEEEKRAAQRQKAKSR